MYVFVRSNTVRLRLENDCVEFSFCSAYYIFSKWLLRLNTVPNLLIKSKKTNVFDAPINTRARVPGHDSAGTVLRQKRVTKGVRLGNQ